MVRPTVEGVVFDVGSVLANVSYDTIAENIGRHSPMALVDIRALLVGTDLEFDSESGKYDSREYFRRVKQRIGGEAAWQYDQFVSEFKTGLGLRADGEASLRYAAAHHRIFLMSNTGYLHSLWMYEQEVLATLPEQSFFSFREGIMKPDRRLWEIFFARTGLAPEQCLFIDDRLENCEAAAKLGVQTINFILGGVSLLDSLKNHLQEAA
jgi:FMN phosphatase YigB (HAD superfamily)